MNDRMEKVLDKVSRVLMVAVIVAAAVLALHYVRRIFFFERFTVKGNSMSPTLEGGTPLWVNKMIIGPRIYTDFDFEKPEMSCVRFPGLRRLRPGDIAVFNYPWGWKEGTIGFKINYVYAKRCVGVPGDTVMIKDCVVMNSSSPTGLPESRQEVLRSIPDSVLLKRHCLKAGHFAGKDNEWTVKDMGPVVVPGKGMTVKMDTLTAGIYSLVIRHETGGAPVTGDGGTVSLDGETIDSYTFKEDYCLFFGDNAVDSKDSRYIGFVPEKFVVGVIMKRGLK